MCIAPHLSTYTFTDHSAHHSPICIYLSDTPGLWILDNYYYTEITDPSSEETFLNCMCVHASCQCIGTEGLSLDSTITDNTYTCYNYGQFIKVTQVEAHLHVPHAKIANH